MVQRQKDEVRERVLAAALKLFARHGYRKASMAQIAAEANVATGNLYRYFRSKEDLFAAVVPNSFVRELFARMARKVHALDGVDDIRALPAGSEYRRISAEQLDFCVRNRLRMIILTTGAAGSPLADIPEKVVGALKSLALEHFRSVSPAPTLTPVHRAMLDLAYRNFVRAMSAILLKFGRERDIHRAMDVYIQYHITGLRAMFETPVDQTPDERNRSGEQSTRARRNRDGGSSVAGRTGVARRGRARCRS